MRRALPVLAALAGLAGWLDFSRIHQSQHADSLVPVLAGLTAWTPFFWGQDRLGMLIPLLALPVRSPGPHLMVEGFLALGLSALGLVLLVRVLLPRRVSWAAPSALLFVLVLVLAPPNERFDILWLHQPYTQSFGLGLGAVALLERRGKLRMAAAALLLLAAAWVNVAVGSVVGPLAVWRALLTDTGRAELGRLGLALGSVVLVAAATVCSVLASSSVDLPATPHELLPAGAWPEAAAGLLRVAWRTPGMRAWLEVSLLLALLGLLALAFRRIRAEAGPVLAAAAGLTAVSVVPFGVAATSLWVQKNGYAVRYLIPSLLLVEAALCLLATLPLLAVAREDRGMVRAASLGAVAVAILVTVGPPSTRAVTDAFEARWGAAARDVAASGATHVTGDYWKVWPTVFTTDWLLGSSRRSRWPYGLTDRSIATLERARAVERPRVAVLDGNGAWLGLLGPHRWAVVERRPTCLVLSGN